MIFDFTNMNELKDIDIQNNYNKEYENYLRKVYQDYERFIKEDLINIIKIYKNKRIDIQAMPVFNFTTKSSLFENIRYEWITNFFRENNLGTIKTFNAPPDHLDNDKYKVRHSLKVQFNIFFSSRANLNNLYASCKKEIPCFEDMLHTLKTNPIERVKKELLKQRKEVFLTDEIKDKLTSIIPNINFENPLLPYVMFKIVVNELNYRHYLANIPENERLYNLILLMNDMGFMLDEIAMFLNVSNEEIIDIIKVKALKLSLD